MVQVYFSHTGEAPLFGVRGSETVSPGTVRHIFYELATRHPSLLDEVLDKSATKLNSATALYTHIEVDPDGRLLETKQTRQLRSLDEDVSEEDVNLLVALFHPEQLMKFLLETLTPTDTRPIRAVNTKRATYRAYINAPSADVSGPRLFVKAQPEELYPFTNGRPIRELITDDVIDTKRHRLLPRPLYSAIARLWDIDEERALRLFQEEALQHILQELSASNEQAKRPLLLSIPTGGGKTEAFLIPLIAHLHDQRKRNLRAGQVPAAAIRALVLYPTRALANDQAKRIAEILFQMNSEVVLDQKISVGVLTGDTPETGHNLLTEKSILQLCPRCSAVLTNFTAKVLPSNSTKMMVARCICGAEIDYFRLVRRDILHHPPDILITSPDMINYMLQSPLYHQHVFSPSIEIAVFDEIHMYSSVFGCNVAHLLRRFEEACGRKPLYVGVSATIRNAKDLACLIFNADPTAVRYLRPQRRGEQESNELRPYVDYQAPPDRLRYHYAATPAPINEDRVQEVETSIVHVADVIGHMIRDPHFRKTLIFANFRQSTDDILRFLRDQEDRYYITYRDHISPRLLSSRGGQTTPLSFSDIELDVIGSVDRWYQLAREVGILYEPNLELGWHRGGLEREERIKAVNRFSATRRLNVRGEENAELPVDVMVATSTLELGIDIGDVTTVINCDAPFTVNEYIQRIGRGGRRKDALALTIVNPRNALDFYFLKHFEEFVHPTPETFEDAPIIISNKEIIKSHIYARLLDRLAYYMGERSETKLQKTIVFSNLLDIQLPGGLTTFRNDHETIAQSLFQEIFTPSRVQQLQEWINREAAIIPDIHATTITMEELWDWWTEKCDQIYQHFGDNKLSEMDELSGVTPKDRDLVPDLRNSGPNVGFYIVREADEDKLGDTVSRRQAISSRPIGSYASQGSITFKIEGIKEQDLEAEKKIKRLLFRSEQAVKYFHTMFGDQANKSPFPEDPSEVLIEVHLCVPRDLQVKYNPYRFYCPKCGATYSDKKPGDERCQYCYSQVRQLTEIYTCGGCGKIYVPPVPKVCLNPACIERATSRKDNSRFMNGGFKRVGKGDQHNEYFRFTALPSLHWQCRACGTEINYHAHNELSPVLRKQIENVAFGNETPVKLAKQFLFHPESFWGSTYEKDGFHPARFSCAECKKVNKFRRITVKNVPSFRTVVHEYIQHERQEIAPSLLTVIGTLDFYAVDVISLAREHLRRFWNYSVHSMSFDLKQIFTDHNSYLANTYSAHAVFFRFGRSLEQFITTQASACCHLNEQCQCRRGTQQDSEKEDQTAPQSRLLPWERGRKPDPRRKWCDVVQGSLIGKGCPGEDIPCNECSSYFDHGRFQRYLVLHTLEHAIVNVMPKYTGINKNQVRGTILPNDEKEYDLVLVDLIEGGSGCMYLLRKNWSQIWQLVGELLESACGEHGQLLLPHTCSRYNRDLCPDLAYAFYQYVEQQEK